MGQPMPAQHPSVVLRSHFNLVRTLLIIAMAALIATAAAVVILANDDNNADTASKATSAVLPPTQTPAGTRYDGGPDEGTRAIASPPAAGTRYDGGPDEGSRGPVQSQFKERAGGPTNLVPQGPGAR